VQESEPIESKNEPVPVEEDSANKSGYLQGFTGMFKRIIKETATLVTAQEETKIE
jgi:hypothetical protein